MSKAIMDAFDLPVLEDLLKASRPTESDAQDDQVTDEIAEQYDDSLNLKPISPQSREISLNIVETRREMDHDSSTETIYKEALQHAKDLMDLGYNVDTRSAKGIFENAASMFKIALDAKNAKRDGHFKQQKMDIERRKMDLAERQIKGPDGNEVEGEAVIIEDRNELIRKMREQAGKK